MKAYHTEQKFNEVEFAKNPFRPVVLLSVIILSANSAKLNSMFDESLGCVGFFTQIQQSKFYARGIHWL